ncbi:ABC-three component system middle component 4 [Zunongwangia sp.]|uniref:ABC-three component system middle component 4 n=1 Tax=Zunongwangia sp. TaxID=1965325 RepID=UPI003AA91ADF
MDSIPIYLPDNDIKLKICQICILLENLSLNSKNNPVLTIDKISLFDFLSKHPLILNRILKRNNREEFSYTESEIQSIESVFPNKKSLYDYHGIKAILKTLILYDLAKIEYGKKMEIFYVISDKGKIFSSELDSLYFKRLANIYEKISPLKTTPFSRINKLVDYYLSHGKTN